MKTLLFKSKNKKNREKGNKHAPGRCVYALSMKKFKAKVNGGE
ncbi:hypothetical protein AAEX28_12405 [Lentisphaerota bacterium WC36G]